MRPFRRSRKAGSFTGPASLVLAALLPVILLLSGCSEKEPLRIGFAGGLSGRVADLGISGSNGAVLAVEKRNRAGGVKGRAVKLIVRDDEQKAEAALRVDGELISLGVEAIVGHMTSSMTMAAVDLVNESGTIMVSPTTTTTYLTGKDDNFLRVTATTREYAAKMARHLRERLDLGAVAVVYDLGNREYTESWYRDFQEEFERLGGSIESVETYRSGTDTHFYDVVDRALVPEAEGLVLIAGAMDTAMFSQQVRKIGRDIPIAAAEWAATEQLVDLGGAAVEGIIVSQFFDRESTAPDYNAFRWIYLERFGEHPGFASVNAYDATLVVLEALEKRRQGETLKEAILRISTFPGVQGAVKIDPFGDADRETFITTIRDGRFRVLE